MKPHKHDDARTRRDLRLAMLTTAATFALEFAGGVFSNSLALLSDSAHVLSDVIAMAIALFALGLALRPSTAKRTFGYHRAEVFAAFLNGALLLAMALLIFSEAYKRLLSPQPVESGEVLAIAFIGLLSNLFVVFKLHGHGNLNVRSALYHAAGDALSSVGVIASAIGMMLTGYYALDAFVSLFIVVIILYGAYKVLRTSLHILFESSPYGIGADRVCRALGSVPGVKGAHDVHVWCVCSDITYVTAHIVMRDMKLSRAQKLAEKIDKKLRKELGVSHTALQMETPGNGHVSEETCNIGH